MQTLHTLLPIFLFLLLGIVFGKSGFLQLPVKTRTVLPLLDRIILLTLSIMLFFMGVRIGVIENFGQKLLEIGLISVSFAIATVIGTSVIVLFTLFLLRGIIHRPKPHKEKIHLLHHLKEPVYLLSVMITGITSGLYVPILKSINGNITTWLLYILLFLIGVQLANNRVKTKEKNAFYYIVILMLPLSTTMGSLLGGLAIGGFFNLSHGESLSLAAGFGWYTLSGVLITDMGNPVLGSAGFMINLFRETIALISIPILGRTRFSLVSIGIAGATSMDVTLPLIERSCGTEYVPLALSHGIILSLLVPLLVPLFYHL
ncbi:MAG: lysine exporter LysO family protein [Spirochaetes bacterium]|nr:MAG: lysine exporter LysO family protein [Spirochaetota bacterium]